jgi:propanediol dehydratase small subunit
MDNFTLTPDIHGVTIRIGTQTLHVPAELAQALGRALVATTAKSAATRHLDGHASLGRG